MRKCLLIIFAILAGFLQAQTKKQTAIKREKTEKKWVNPVKLTKEERNRPYMDEVLKTRDSLTPNEAERRRKNIAIGNPFAKYGYYPKIATLSKGKYLEFHDMDSIVKIGSVRFNRKTKSITEFREIDLSDPDAQPYLDTAGRWISPDPLSEEFPSWTPYNFVFNNPLKFTDPDGRAPEEVNCCWWLRLMPLFENSSVRPSPVIETVTKTGEATKNPNDHHIIPRQFKNTEVVKEAREKGFEFEGKENKIELEQFSKATGEGRHANHPKYNQQVGELLKEISKSNALDGVKNLKDKLTDIIKNNPDTKVNDLKLKNTSPVKTDNLQNTTPPPAVLPKPVAPLTPSQKCARDPNCV